MRFLHITVNYKLQKLNNSSHEVQISHLHAKGLFLGSKLEGIRFPFCRKMMLSQSSGTSFQEKGWYGWATVNLELPQTYYFQRQCEWTSVSG